MISSDTAPSKDLMRKVDQGIEEAIRYILQSAKNGYPVIGSDVGGYSGKIIPPRLYIRWAQFSTFCGLFLNGGHGNRALWERSKEELEIIRKYSWLHTELIPYMYSYVVSAHNGGTRLQHPVEGKYHYMFGMPYFNDVVKIKKKSDYATMIARINKNRCKIAIFTRATKRFLKGSSINRST
jgi:hypothetical protein